MSVNLSPNTGISNVIALRLFSNPLIVATFKIIMIALKRR